ncbi:SMI1/KNR4 family protein [Kurthia gibsonii]|uniref:SMI1/KNR4 family protein n=1 Tax=Kurthia gibsonii TaxID=33946 RepID=UPI002DB720A7|nr:SMI1/KNR4 family protein [Kurthia gibsonii]MEB7771068.1 SMI1/KNR4 family protein [Kurthia gibsonii]
MFDYIFEGEADFEDFSLDDLKKVEKLLGVKLPESYINLMKIHNGGTLAYSILRSGRVPDGEVEITDLRGIDLEEGIGETNYLVEEWGMEKGLVIISGDGNYWLALDYRKHTGNEPPVVYIEEDTDEKPKQVAKTFELFLKKLEKPEEDDFDIEYEDDDEDDIIYTKEEFEHFVKEGESYVEIANCFEQFSQTDKDFDWFVTLAIKTIKFKEMEGIWYRVGEETLNKMNCTPKEKWSITLLDELADGFINFVDSNGFANPGVIKYGKKIKRKIEKL